MNNVLQIDTSGDKIDTEKKLSLSLDKIFQNK